MTLLFLFSCAERWQAVATGPHTCAVDLSGAVACWDCTTDDECGPRDGPYVDIVVSDTFNCGKFADGAIECWGAELYPNGDDDLGIDGAIDVEEETYTSMAVGTDSMCAVTEAGAVRCCRPIMEWDPESEVRLPHHPVSAGALHIATTGGFGCALMEDASLECWHAPLGEGDTAPLGAFPPEQPGWKQVAAGSNGACGVTTQGETECWGNGYWEQYQTGELGVPQAEFTAVDAGSESACGIDEAGSITCWGDNDWDRFEYVPGGAWAEVVVENVAACALDDVGVLDCWGWTKAGVADDGPGSTLGLASW